MTSTMLTRRRFLRGATTVAAGSVAGLGIVWLGRQFLVAPRNGAGESFSSFDDDFDGPNEEWVVAGSESVHFDEDAHPGAVFLGSGMVIHRARLPAPPFTVTARCSELLFNDVYSQFANASLAIGGRSNPTTTGPSYYALQWDVAFLGEIGIIDGVWSDYTTQIHQNHYMKLGDGTEFQTPHFQRLVVASESDVSAFWSLDGEAWNTYIEHFDPHLGVRMDSVLLLAYGCEAAFDWVRFSR